MRIVLATLLCLVVAPAHAELTGSLFLKGRNRDDVKAHLSGIVNGLGVANAANTMAHQSLLYCSPPKLGIQEDQAERIVIEFLREHPQLGDQPLSGIVLFAFKDVFPCK